MTKRLHIPPRLRFSLLKSWQFPILFLLLCVGKVDHVYSDVLITEFVADNDGSYLDEDGDEVDWIEIYNDSSASVNLSGWSLSDDIGNLAKWIFPPGTILGPHQYRLIFASGKNRRTVDQPFHTNFSLKKDGEYLALVRDDGATVEHDFSPEYPPQYQGMSYGLDQTANQTTVISSGAQGQAGVPTSAADFSNEYTNWERDKTGTFSGDSWQGINTGVGYETSSGYGIWLGSDLETEMHGNNSSVFLRIPFTVADASAVRSLLLRLRWDDGFVAYINGEQVAADRNPASPQWNSSATTNRGDGLNEDWTAFPIAAETLGLVNGVNILAIHGLNQSPTSSDMLILPELDLVLAATPSSTAGYQLTPSPGEANGIGILDVPPYLTEVTNSATRPTGGAGSTPIIVTASVRETKDEIDSVSVFYRVMFGNEVELPMNDSGSGADEIGGDGIYSAFLPTAGMNPGEMIRWRMEAEDVASRTAAAPFFADPLDSDRYFGTVTQNSSLSSSQLPILETFVEDEVAVNTRGGTRTSVYFLGEFYDNIQMDLHGQSTAGFPKKSYDLDFNKGNRFRWNPEEQRVKDINLLTNWADKSKSRNTLGYEFLKNCGVAYHYAFPVRVERNGAFFSTADMVEDGDDRYLERIGLDPKGSLYKMYDRMIDATRSSKKTRHHEGVEDLAALIAGINDSLPRDTRRAYAYDHVDLASTVNYLASLVVIGISDTGHKNYYMYRDTEGSGEWRPLPWDVDLSAGRRWNSTDRYFDDTLFSNIWTKNTNRLWELIHNTPEYQDMILRRIQTLRTEVLLAPGTAFSNDWYSQRAAQLADLLDSSGVTSDADLDYAKWGSWGNANEARTASARIVSEWLPAKRDYLFSSSRTLGGKPVPAAQPGTPSITIETVDFLPASGNQDEEFFVLKNRESTSVDISAWSISGAVNFTFPPGSVIPSGTGTVGDDYIGLLHVARNSKAFRARGDAVTGGQYRFVQGGYDGQLSARGETIEFRNKQGELVSSKGYIGDPSLLQEHLRITEVMYHPTAIDSISPDPQDFEFVELRNTSNTESLDLNGNNFTKGIAFDFTGSSVTSLLPGEYALVVSNEAAFTARHGSGLPVAGEFYGSLDNGGETLRLEDAVGEEILEFKFRDSWQPLTDGLGFSLVIKNDRGGWETWDLKDSWRISGLEGGTPGTTVIPLAISPVVVNELLAHTDLPEVDSIELHNPGPDDIDIGGWFLSDEFAVPRKFRIPDGTTIPAGGFVIFDESDFSSGPNPFLLSEYGEQAYLFSGNTNSDLTGYYHGWDFKASPNGVTSGRYEDSQGKVHFVLQTSNTLGAANSLPRVGPVVISEIHYHPTDLAGGVDNSTDEFIELTNTSSSTVPLYGTDTGVPGYGNAALNDTWHLRNAVDFDFPAGVSLEAGERVLVVGFDPAASPGQLASFRTKFSIPENIEIYGPWSGKLDNSGEEIELKYPGSADFAESFIVPYYTMEEIDYKDASPWPVVADGSGSSLQRLNFFEFGNDPENWVADIPQVGVTGDSDRDGMNDEWEIIHGLIVGVDDSGLDLDSDGRTNIDEFNEGTSPSDPKSFLNLSISSTATGLILHFTALPNVRYTIQSTDTLSPPANWMTLQEVSAETEEREIQIEIEETESRRFYRIIVIPFH